MGIDLEEGPGVDIVCNAEEVLDKFGPESFDVNYFGLKLLNM